MLETLSAQLETTTNVVETTVNVVPLGCSGRRGRISGGRHGRSGTYQAELETSIGQLGITTNLVETTRQCWKP